MSGKLLTQVRNYSLLPVNVNSDAGIEQFPAPYIHSHKLFDDGTELPLKTNWANVHASMPLRVHKAADWVVIHGIVTWTAVSPGVVNVPFFDLPEEYYPADPNDRTLPDLFYVWYLMETTSVYPVIKGAFFNPGPPNVGMTAPIQNAVYFIGVNWRAR